MPGSDYAVFLIMGGAFIVVGIIMYIWGSREEARYYNSLYTRPDVREFLERLPRHPEPGALKTGSRIAVAVGIIMLALGGVFWRWG